MMITEKTLPTDTKAILLLCGYLTPGSKTNSQPLTLTEYNKFAAWLHKKELRPEDLLTPAGGEQINQYAEGKVTPERLQDLLGRGVALGFALEEWTRQGIWVLSRGESEYPTLLKNHLRTSAPALLFGVGNKQLLNSGGLGIVGSRDADAEALNFAREVAEHCKSEDITVISGSARGVDSDAMLAVLAAQGNAIGVMPEGVAKSALSKAYRNHIAEGRLVLISPYHPNARWSAGNAMGRNRLIYAFSNWTLVVSSSTDGGTWSGATENLKKRWVPLFVRMDAQIPQGNQKLIDMGGIPLSLQELTAERLSLRKYLNARATNQDDKQLTLFSTHDSNTSSIKEEGGEIPAQVLAEKEPSTVSASIENGIYNKNDVNGLIDRSTTDCDMPKAISSESVTPDHYLQTSSENSQKNVISVTTTGDLFTIVWPSIASAFPQECTKQDISNLANQFNVQTGQMQAWIKQAVEENLLIKETKPVRYFLQQSDR